MATETTTQETTTNEEPPKVESKTEGTVDHEKALADARAEIDRLKAEQKTLISQRQEFKSKARESEDLAQRLDVVVGEFQALRDRAIQDKSRAVDIAAAQALPEHLRPFAPEILAGLRAKDKTLQITADADTDAVITKTLAILAERSKQTPAPPSTPPNSPAPARPATVSPDWKTAKTPAEMLKILNGG